MLLTISIITLLVSLYLKYREVRDRENQHNLISEQRWREASARTRYEIWLDT